MAERYTFNTFPPTVFAETYIFKNKLTCKMYGDRAGERNILPKYILVYEKENY